MQRLCHVQELSKNSNVIYDNIGMDGCAAFRAGHPRGVLAALTKLTRKIAGAPRSQCSAGLRFQATVVRTLKLTHAVGMQRITIAQSTWGQL